MAWHLIIDFEPPIFGCTIINRNYTFDILKATGECVINIPTVELAEKVMGCENISGRKVGKFKIFGGAQAPASCIKAPFIDERYANLACKVVDGKMLNKYNVFIIAVIKAWIDPAN